MYRNASACAGPPDICSVSRNCRSISYIALVARGTSDDARWGDRGRLTLRVIRKKKGAVRCHAGDSVAFQLLGRERGHVRRRAKFREEVRRYLHWPRFVHRTDNVYCRRRRIWEDWKRGLHVRVHHQLRVSGACPMMRNGVSVVGTARPVPLSIMITGRPNLR